MEIRRDIQSRLVETPAAKETVLYANTPSFLFERLRKDTSASYVSRKLTPDEIVVLLSEKSMGPRNPVDLLWIYVLLAGLSLKTPDDIRRIQDDLNRIDFSHVQWGDQLRAAILSRGPRTNIVEINYKENRNEHPTANSNVATGHVVNSGSRR